MTRQFIEDMFAAVDRRDWDRLAEAFHPDLRYDRPGFAPLVGRVAVVHFYREIRAIHGQHLLEATVVEGDRAAAWGRFVGAKRDGTAVDVEFADCYQFSDGLLWRRKSFFFVPTV